VLNYIDDRANAIYDDHRDAPYYRIPILKSLKLITLSENFIKKYRGKVNATNINVNTRFLLLSAEIEYPLIKCDFPVKSLNFQQCRNGLST
jgi:hypothetical protein